MSSLGFGVMRMMAFNAIESAEASKDASAATRDAAVNAGHQKLAALEKAATAQTVGTINAVAQQGMAVAQSAQSVGDSVNTATDKYGARAAVDTAQQQPESADSNAFSDISLGEGITVGDRFPGAQGEALASGDFSTENLSQAGFGEEDVKALQELAGEDGEVDTNDLADWMVDNRLTARQSKAKNQSKARGQQIPKMIFDSVGKAAETMEKQAREDEERAAEFGSKIRDIGENFVDDSMSYQKALGEAQLGFLKGGEKQPGS